MSVISVSPPYPVFPDAEGESLEAGYIFIAGAGQNPLVSTNQIAVYADAALTIPMAQPVRTNGGFPVNSGSPTQIYAGVADYSIAILNAAGQLVFSSLTNKTKLGVIDLSTDVTGLLDLTTHVSGTLLSTFIKYDITPAETAATVTPTNYFYPPGDLRRYGCTLDGTGDNTTNIQNAVNAGAAATGVGYIYHPGGNIAHTGQISIPASFMVRGFNRDVCKFTFNGNPGGSPAKTRSAWRYESGTVNTSRFSNVHFEHVWIFYSNSINFSGGIEINAGGGSYFSFNNVRVDGNSSYGLMLDSVEICFVYKCNLGNVSGITTGASIYITNGPTRSAGQGLGWSNVITISDTQMAGGGAAAAAGIGITGIVDEGGNELTVTGNNLDGHRFAASFSGRSNLTSHGNSFETPLATGTANVVFGATDQAGAFVGPCTGVSIKSCGFFGNMSAGSLLAFSTTAMTVTNVTKAASAVITVNVVSTVNPFFVGYPLTIDGVVGMTQINKKSAQVSAIGGASGAWTATIPLDSTAFSNYVSGGQILGYHFGVDVRSCFFGSQTGRGGAIDVTYLANSSVGPNFDAGNSSMTHYVGAHTDVLGNFLLPPQNGFPGTLGINGPTWGDTRFRHSFNSCIQFATPFTIPYSASMSWDLKEANMFEVTPTNAVAFLLNNPANVIGGGKFSVWIINTTGGALGAMTFGASYRVTAAWVQPATGFRRRIDFEVSASGLMYETGRSTADVPN